MNIRVLILTFLVAATGGAAYWLNQSGKEEKPQETRFLFSDLSSAAGAINTVSIENHAGIIFSAKQENGKWLATHLEGAQSFPVNTDALSALVSTLAQTHILEAKTSKTQNYSRLGVEGLSSDDAQSTLVRLASAKHQWQVLVGNVASNGMGNFVRHPQKKHSFLIDSVIRLPASSSDWLKKDVVPFKTSEVVKVEMVSNNRSPLVIERMDTSTNDWELKGLGEGERLAYSGILARTVADLVNFRFDRAHPYVQSQWDNAELVADVSFTLADNSQVFAYVSQEEGGDTRKVWFNTPDSPSWINEWVFEITEYQAQPFIVSRKDLLASGSQLLNEKQ
ncbi:DUF4340 domain-containing protein [Alteromonas pelagimontana]|uniref:DUF4340 domain-containing protein n=1 Tax=Alteromonas pelagimontana TaxID=1858656 RepID=A0A6M4MG14_9ALTE|nr:DUF4340 domain-containing protein [Alteromonas pelagimontana]QJR82059.1 DUF4340 domain-containing protein [Alteromonas pelagimontana]